MTRPLDPLPDERLTELERLLQDGLLNEHPSWTWFHFAAFREALPSLLAEVRAARAGRDARATPDADEGASPVGGARPR